MTYVGFVKRHFCEAISFSQEFTRIDPPPRSAALIARRQKQKKPTRLPDHGNRAGFASPPNLMAQSPSSPSC